MRAFVLLTAATFTIGIAGSAHSAVLTLGGPLAYLCYQSALAADRSSSALEGCSRALEEEALATNDRAATYVNRGIVLMSGGRLSEADVDFDAALKLSQNLPDGWLNKGFLRLRTGNGREALPLIQKGIDAGAANQALAIFARGVAHEQMGEFGKAYADLKIAQRLAPGWSMPTEYLARYRVTQRY